MYKVIKHPLIKVKLSVMRDKKTSSRDFRSNLVELTQFMAFEVTKDLKVDSIKIKTPLATAEGFKLKDDVVLVPILRAGLGMVDGFRNMLPSAPVGFIGLYRDEKTLKPIKYYDKMPDCIKGSIVLLLDPMLATGYSSAAAITMLKTYKPKQIKFVCILSSPEGLKIVEKAHPDIEIYTACVDKQLNDQGYIVPGLGDAGDRIFKTK